MRPPHVAEPAVLLPASHPDPRVLGAGLLRCGTPRRLRVRPEWSSSIRHPHRVAAQARFSPVHVREVPVQPSGKGNACKERDRQRAETPRGGARSSVGPGHAPILAGSVATRERTSSCQSNRIGSSNGALVVLSQALWAWRSAASSMPNTKATGTEIAVARTKAHPGRTVLRVASSYTSPIA